MYHRRTRNTRTTLRHPLSPADRIGYPHERTDAGARPPVRALSLGRGSAPHAHRSLGRLGRLAPRQPERTQRLCRLHFRRNRQAVPPGRIETDESGRDKPSRLIPLGHIIDPPGPRAHLIAQGRRPGVGRYRLAVHHPGVGRVVRLGPLHARLVVPCLHSGAHAASPIHAGGRKPAVPLGARDPRIQLDGVPNHHVDMRPPPVPALTCNVQADPRTPTLVHRPHGPCPPIRGPQQHPQQVSGRKHTHHARIRCALPRVRCRKYHVKPGSRSPELSDRPISPALMRAGTRTTATWAPLPIAMMQDRPRLPDRRLRPRDTRHAPHAPAKRISRRIQLGRIGVDLEGRHNGSRVTGPQRGQVHAGL